MSVFRRENLNFCNDFEFPISKQGTYKQIYILLFSICTMKLKEVLSVYDLSPKHFKKYIAKLLLVYAVLESAKNETMYFLRENSWSLLYIKYV